MPDYVNVGDLAKIYVNGDEIDKVYVNQDLIYSSYTPEYYLKFTSPSSFTLVTNNSTKNWDGTLEYSTNGGSSWSTWIGTTITAGSVDGNYAIYLRGTGNTKITGSSFNYRWAFTGSNISCTGNIEYLLDWSTVAQGNHPPMASYCYSHIFEGCSSLISAPELPATTLATYCYDRMFSSCSSLTTAPELPATTLASYCYNAMFEMTNITTAPELPATTLANYCYSEMFGGCTSLTTAPELPATTLASYCYYCMFMSCTSLTTAPALPATTLVDSCYLNMFNGCARLTTPPIIAGGTTQATPAPYCCQQMFYGCTSLNIYTSSSGHTAFYKAITYSTRSGPTDERSSYRMFYLCKINGSMSTTNYLTAGTQYYY